MMSNVEKEAEDRWKHLLGKTQGVRWMGNDHVFNFAKLHGVSLEDATIKYMCGLFMNFTGSYISGGQQMNNETNWEIKNGEIFYQSSPCWSPEKWQPNYGFGGYGSSIVSKANWLKLTDEQKKSAYYPLGDKYYGWYGEVFNRNFVGYGKKTLTEGFKYPTVVDIEGKRYGLFNDMSKQIEGKEFAGERFDYGRLRESEDKPLYVDCIFYSCMFESGYQRTFFYNCQFFDCEFSNSVENRIKFHFLECDFEECDIDVELQRNTTRSEISIIAELCTYSGCNGFSVAESTGILSSVWLHSDVVNRMLLGVNPFEYSRMRVGTPGERARARLLYLRRHPEKGYSCAIAAIPPK